MRRPCDKDTLFEFADLLLHDKKFRICDVTLQSTDDFKFPACSKLIMMRSKFLDRLLKTKLGKRKRGFLVNVPVKSVALQEILFYCYTRHSTIVERYCNRGDEKELNIADYCDLVHVSVAARIFQIRELNEWCVDTKQKIYDELPQACCFTLEVLLQYEILIPDAIQKIIRFIKENPRRVLRVPDCVIPRDGLMFAPNRGVKENMLINLSALALSKIINGLVSGNENEYLFQVVYFWATRGQMVQENESPDHLKRHKCSNNKKVVCDDCERWEDAKAILRFLDLRQMRIRFLKDYVKQSGLITDATLCDIFSEYALRLAAPVPSLKVEGRVDTMEAFSMEPKKLKLLSPVSKPRKRR